MRIVQDESELPVRSDRDYFLPNVQWFIRSKINPTVLIEYHDGEAFKRKDGQNWTHPALERTREIKLVDGVRTPTPWTGLVGKGAYCDEKIYGAANTKVAA